MSLEQDGMVTEDFAGAAAPAPAADAKASKPDAKPAVPAADKAPAKAEPAAKPTSTSTSIFDDDDDGDDAPAQDPKKTGTAPVKATDGEADGGEGGEAEVKPEPTAWPDDWRERIAGTDEKMLAEMKRFASFENWAKSQRALRQKLASGEYKKADEFDPGWNDEKKAEWRKAQGIPDKPEGYALPEIDGHKWSDADKAAMAPLLEQMHATNAKPEAVQAVLGYYANVLQNVVEKRVAADREHKANLEDHLRAEWGPDYRPNVKLMQRALNDPELIPGGMGEGGLGAAIMAARLDNGQRLINMPGMATFLAQLAREKYGEGSLIPASEMTSLSTREDEITRIMNTDIQRYYRERNSKGQTMEQELAEIMRRKEGRRAA